MDVFSWRQISDFSKRHVSEVKGSILYERLWPVGWAEERGAEVSSTCPVCFHLAGRAEASR